MKKYIPLLLIILSAACSSAANNLFIDVNKSPIEKFNQHAAVILQYFPQKILPIIIKDGDYSSFDINNRTVYLDTKNSAPSQLPMLALHEAVHIINYDVSNGYSLDEAPRFIDEGLATIVGAEVADGSATPYKEIIALCQAKKALEKGTLTFKNMMSWKSYAGDYMNVAKFYQTANYHAYEEAASFVYFLTENHGKTAPYNLIIDMASTRNLEQSFKNVLNKNQAELEKEWHAYVTAGSCKTKEEFFKDKR